jgi:hypothetical protein
MAYRRMGAVEELGIDLTAAYDAIPQNWQGPLVTTGLAPSPLVTTGVPATTEGGIPTLLARPAETGGSGGTPWLLFAGLGLVAYLFMK